MSDPDPRNSSPHPAVRLLPARVAREAIAAAAGQVRSRPPQLFRPERLEQLRDVAHAASCGKPVVLHVDRLPPDEQGRARDFAAGIAATLDASLVELRAAPGVAIVPQGDAIPEEEHVAVADPSDSHPQDHLHPPRLAERRDKNITVCVLCDLRPAVEERVPSLDLVVLRDGSRAQPPPIRLCAHCARTLRNWRFTVVWCSGCERWGRRGVRSPCGSAFGT